LTKIFDKATVMNFTGNEMTLGFKSLPMADMSRKYQQQFEEAIAQVAGREIKISVVVDKNLPPTVLRNMSEPERSNLAGAMDILQASDATKIKD